MPIGSIITQPASNALQAAYAPILVRATATATGGGTTPPIVYCDIYFRGIYYKTLSKTLYTKLNVSNTEWEFDLQDAAQEYLSHTLPAVGFSSIIEVTTAIALASVRFRSSGLNSDGFMVPEGTAPIQGTGSTAPTSGSGTESNPFFIVNATLQNENNPDLASHLAAYQNGGWSNAYPLSHRSNNYKLTRIDSDAFAFVYTGPNPLVTLQLNYKLRNQFTFHQVSATPSFDASINVVRILYLPSGPVNLAPLFPAIDFFNVEEYYLVMLDSTGAEVATTPKVQLVVSTDDVVRICFINSLGTIDALNFKSLTQIHETKSDQYQRRRTSVKSDHVIARSNIKANDTYTASTISYAESELDYLDEFFDAPLHWLQVAGTEGQSDAYIPLTVSDMKTPKQTTEDRYTYEVQIEYILSREKITLRN